MRGTPQEIRSNCLRRSSPCLFARRQQNDTRLGSEVEEDLRSHQQIATENGLQPQTCEKRSQGGRRCGGSDINRARAAAEVDRDEVQIAFKSANGRMKTVMTTDDGRVRK